MRRKRIDQPVKRAKGPEIISSRGVVELRYKHAIDGHYYVHRFTPGECVVELLVDGSVHLLNPRGAPLWAEF